MKELYLAIWYRYGSLDYEMCETLKEAQEELSGIENIGAGSSVCIYDIEKGKIIEWSWTYSQESWISPDLAEVENEVKELIEKYKSDDS